jgi:hypothetical protein
MTNLKNRPRDPLDLAWWTLKIGLGVGPVIIGIDKYFNRLADWSMYLSPLATRILPFSPTFFMRTIGPIEILAGILVLSRWTRIGSYVVMAWLLAIAVNLLATGMFYDLAMRDVEIVLGAFALSQLSALREQRDQDVFHSDAEAPSPLVMPR